MYKMYAHLLYNRNQHITFLFFYMTEASPSSHVVKKIKMFHEITINEIVVLNDKLCTSNKKSKIKTNHLSNKSDD